MKFESNWPNKFLQKICFNILMGLEYEGPWLKGQPLELIYSHFHIRSNISSENNDFGLKRFPKKSTFQKIPRLNALESKFDVK